MNILCRVDANASMGIGHLMRCLALAQELVQHDIQVAFFVNTVTAKLCQSRKDWIGELIVLPDSITKNDELDWLQKNNDLSDFDGILLDGYQFDLNYQKSIKSLLEPESRCLIMFDDNNDSGELAADMIINGASHAMQLNYQQTTSNAQLCLGDKFRVLRNEFTQNPLANTSFDERTDLTIMMGGSDTLDITLAFLINLEKVLDTELSINVITGAAYQKLEQLTDFIKTSSLKIKHLHNCQQVAKTFSKSKLVVSAAGSSQFEVLACGAASILVIVAENQAGSVIELASKGCAELFDGRQDFDVKDLVNQSLKLWNDDAKLNKMHELALQLADVNGANRIALKVLALVNKNTESCSL